MFGRLIIQTANQCSAHPDFRNDLPFWPWAEIVSMVGVELIASSFAVRAAIGRC